MGPKTLVIGLQDPFQNVQEHDHIFKIEQDMPCRSWEIFGNFEKSTLLQMPQIANGPQFLS